MNFCSWISADGKLIMLEKCVRTVPYGFLSVLFAVYLSQLGFDVYLIGLVLTLTVFTSAFYTFAVSFMADRYGRKRTLIFFLLMDFTAGVLLFASTAWWAVILAGAVGNFSIGAGEVGPFLSLEQAMLPTTSDSKHRTLAFTFYNLAGYASSAVGALLAALSQYFLSGPAAYRPLFLLYLSSGVIGAVLYSRMSRNVEVVLRSKTHKRPILSERSKPIVWKLSGLFFLDSFGGGFVLQSIMSYYFYERFALQLSSLGLIFSASQIMMAASLLAAERIARRIGLLNTMVLSQIPSNLLLITIAFAPTTLTAVVLLLCRSATNQMDWPTRQSYIMAVVDETDRTPAAGFTNLARSASQTVSPFFAGYAIAKVWAGFPFLAGGIIKLVYDFILYRSFRRIKPPEEMKKDT